MKRYSLCLAICLAAALSGCGGDSASYMIEGNRDNAFSLFRDKSWPGADWELALVLTHLPDCQRRYPLKPASSGRPYKAELFRNAETYYLLHSADAWYAAQLNGCTLQESKSVPASPGELVGTWEKRDEGFKFFPISR